MSDGHAVYRDVLRRTSTLICDKMQEYGIDVSVNARKNAADDCDYRIVMRYNKERSSENDTRFRKDVEHALSVIRYKIVDEKEWTDTVGNQGITLSINLF